MKERDEIILLCKELEDLGGGINTRLEQVSVCQYGDGFVKNNIMRYLGLNYNASVVTYGAVGTGKSRVLFEELLPALGQALTTELEALFFLEAFEIGIELATEKRVALVSVPGKQAPEVVQFKTQAEFESLIHSIKQRSANFENGRPIPNKAHLFLKVTVWMEGRFQTVTVVDIAGLQSKGTYLERSEINKSAGYLGQIVRSNFTFNPS